MIWILYSFEYKCKFFKNNLASVKYLPTKKTLFFLKNYNKVMRWALIFWKGKNIFWKLFFESRLTCIKDKQNLLMAFFIQKKNRSQNFQRKKKIFLGGSWSCNKFLAYVLAIFELVEVSESILITIRPFLIDLSLKNSI